MKLTAELKKRIDDYFDNITPEELFEISISKYKFKENKLFKVTEGHFTANPIGLRNKTFETKHVHLYKQIVCGQISYTTENSDSDYIKAA